MVAIAAMLLASSTAAADTWALLWNEDFADGSDWTLDARFNVAGGVLQFQPNGAGPAFFGPNYRTAGDSVWNPATNTKVNVSIDNFKIQDLGPGTQNRQGMWSLDTQPAVSMHDPNAAPNGNDWLEFRVADDDANRQWVVLIMDEAVLDTDTYSIGVDPQGKNVDINFTVDTLAKRYWFNFTVEGTAETGSNTGTWAGDGPFAESASIYLTYWSYSTVTAATPTTLDNIAVFTSNAEAPPAQPPPPPPPRKHVKADFGWAESPLGTQFYDRSVGDGVMVAWNWSFGDGYGSRREHPFHTFMCKGNYTIVLQVEDEFGEKGSVSATYRVNETRPLCGIVTRGEEGIHIAARGYVIDIPTGLFIIGAALSAGSLIAGVEIPFFPRGLRYFLLFISVMGLALTLGLFGMIAASIVG